MKYTPNKTIWFGLFLGLFTLMFNDAMAQDSIEKSFEVRSGGKLWIDVDLGKIEIETTSQQSVSVELIRSVKGVSKEEERDILEAHEYSIESGSGGVTVESRFDRDGDDSGVWRRWKDDARFSLEILIRIPKSYNVNFRTGAGNITIADLDGTVKGKTGAGNIVLGMIQGSIDISSGAGNIEVDGAQGTIQVESGAGNITLDRVRGKLDVGTGAGNIVASIVGSFKGDSELESGAGNVTVYLEESVGLDVEATAGIGSAKTDYDLKVRGKWMSKSFEGEVNGGGPKLRLHSGVGNVALRRH